MSQPAISVAMSVYNGERFLAEAIQSVLDQTWHDFELLILDDGSRDSSLEIINRHAAADSRIRVIARENRGLVTSLNQLLAEARAPLIARMDADDVCAPQRFERQIAFLAAQPDHGVVGSLTFDIDENGQAFPLDTAEHPLSHEAFIAHIASNGPLLAHPTVMYRRDVVLAAGGYHAAFRHCEDYDLWLRLAHRTKIANLPERLLRYRHYAGQVSNRHALEQQIGVAVSRLAYAERVAGRPDPTEHLDALPPIEQLDTVFGRKGVAGEVRAHVARALLYSRSEMTGQGFDLLLEHVGEGGRGAELWRTAARLVRFGEPRRALKLVAALAGA
ncbi:glycosyltransferase [Novosphingobium sp.]|uniref:glycosyltransferase family 2 protein n=1 Tax=Novosphingobium sp. TaxID=1874826 RepID=UPI0025F664FB|nr:glycosyltransferase [Novosphingobium sp.]MCC6924385.1 glycosyltransferase [Novosphingobium sp.]